MIIDHGPSKRVPVVLLIIFLAAAACSTNQKQAAGEAAEDRIATPGEQGSSEGNRGSEPTDPEVMYHVFSAEVLGTGGDLAAAAVEYLEAALVSDDPEIAERAAKVAISAGELEIATLASGRWAMLAPDNIEAHELAASARIIGGDYVGAEFHLAKILDMTGGDQAVGWNRVKVLLAKSGDPVRADKVLARLLQEYDPGSSPDAMLVRSQLAARGGDIEEAFGWIESAIEMEPGRPEFHAWSGRLAASVGQESRALESYGEAWRLDKQNQMTSMAYAELLKRDGDLEAAQAVLAQLPDQPEMRFARVIFALEAGDEQGAEVLYDGFGEVGYEDADSAAFHAAQSAELLDRPREAIEWYGQVTGGRQLRAQLRTAMLLAEFGELVEARALLAGIRENAAAMARSQSFQAEAQILEQAGRSDEAMALLTEAVTLLPEDTSLRYARALLAVGLMQLELAENDFRQIIAAEPHNAAAINALGYTLADLTDRYDEAEELIRQAYELEPNDASIIDSMGWIAYRRGRLEEAEHFLREAWDRMRNADIAAHLGEVLWVQGKQEEARSFWRLGVEADAGNAVLLETMQRFGEQP